MVHSHRCKPSDSHLSGKKRAKYYGESVSTLLAIWTSEIEIDEQSNLLFRGSKIKYQFRNIFLESVLIMLGVERFRLMNNLKKAF